MMRLMMNLGRLIEGCAQEVGEKVFLYYEDRKITYGQLEENVNRAANVFLSLGIKRGDRVCFFLPNSPEFIYGWFGLAKIGAVLVPLNTAYRTEETSYIVNHSDAVAMLVHTSLWEVVERIRSETPQLKHLLWVGPDADSMDGPSFGQASAAASINLMDADVGEEDLCEIMYTSGTTGPSKGVMLTHRYWHLVGSAFAHCLGLTSEDRLFTCLPLFHANAQGYSTMGALVTRASLILTERFSASGFWSQIKRYGATEFNYIGAMLSILSKQPESSEDKSHRIRVAYGTPALSAKDEERMENRYGIRFVSGYGLTECGMGTMQPVSGLRKEGSMGAPRQAPGARFTNEIKVVDDQGREAPAGTVGELILRNPAIMKGYFKDPELTARTIRNGWLYTGDYAWMDSNGYFYFADRKKDVIRRRGENVSSLEVERVINAHPKVLESAVIGIPSQFYDDEVKAYIVAKPDEVIDPLEIVAWCREKLAYFKIPRFIELRAKLPKTPTHRVAKYKLRQEREDLSQGCFDLLECGVKLR